jgi:hypothetical protein
MAASSQDPPSEGRLTASASNTRGGSRMQESRPYGSERGRPAMDAPTAIEPMAISTENIPAALPNQNSERSGPKVAGFTPTRSRKMPPLGGLLLLPAYAPARALRAPYSDTIKVGTGDDVIRCGVPTTGDDNSFAPSPRKRPRAQTAPPCVRARDHSAAWRRYALMIPLISARQEPQFVPACRACPIASTVTQPALAAAAI